MTYIYLCGANLCILFIVFLKPSFCNGSETELKWKIGIQNLHNICNLSYTNGCCLVPFSSNISCDRKHNVRLCCDYRRISVVCQSLNDVILELRAEYTANKLLYEACRHKYTSCNSNACQSERGFGLEFVDEVFQMEWHG